MDYHHYLQSSQVRIVKRKFRLGELLDDLRDLFSVQSEIKGIHFRIEVLGSEDDRNEWLYTDQTRLMQVLVNLINNSLKFTLRGFITLRVQIQAQKTRLVHFELEDSGIGIPKDKQEKLFQFFTTFDTKQGNGLGLAMSRTLVQALGPEDKIHLESEVGVGSKFQFIIHQYLDVGAVSEPSNNRASDVSSGFKSVNEMKGSSIQQVKCATYLDMMP